MWKFYVPFYYLVHSRLKSQIDQASWFIIFIVPQFFITYMYSDTEFYRFTLLFLFAQIIFNTLYEIGYIENDIFTAKHERNPTLRLDKSVIEYLQKDYAKVIGLRYLIIIIFLITLSLSSGILSVDLNLLAFIFLLIVNRVVFYMHNQIRNRWNLLTFSILAVTKYIFPMILFITDKSLIYTSLLGIFLFPALRIIEHSTHKRYRFLNYAKMIGSHDRFRIVYYSIAAIVCSFFTYGDILTGEDVIVAMIGFIYFLIFRVASYILVRKGMYKRDVLKSKDLYKKSEIHRRNVRK